MAPDWRNPRSYDSLCCTIFNALTRNSNLYLRLKRSIKRLISTISITAHHMICHLTVPIPLMREYYIECGNIMLYFIYYMCWLLCFYWEKLRYAKPFVLFRVLFSPRNYFPFNILPTLLLSAASGNSMLVHTVRNRGSDKIGRWNVQRERTNTHLRDAYWERVVSSYLLSRW